MKNNLRPIRKIWGVFLIVTVMFGCQPPDVGEDQANGPMPAGLAQVYNDEAWELLSEDDGTFSYRIPEDAMPAITLGDQVVHNGDELREVVNIVEQTQDMLVIHTITGNLMRLFPSDSTLDVDSKTMTATVTYSGANTRSGTASYTLPLTLKQIREKGENDSEIILYNYTQGRSIDLINVNSSTSIINIDKTMTQTLFDVSGEGEKEIGKHGKVSYSGSANLSLEERLKVALNFNIRLYINYDCGINWVRREKTITYWLFGKRTKTIVWYEPVFWDNVKKELKASVSGLAYAGVSANLNCNGELSAAYEVDLPVNYSYSFLIGVVPLEIGYSAKLSAEATLAGSLSATTGAFVSLSGEFGAGCNNNGWNAIKVFSSDYGYTAPTLSASATISVVPKLENEIRLGVGFKDTGVYGTITLSPYLALEAQAGLEPSERMWSASCGVSGDVGVKASLVGYDLGAYDTQIFDFNKLIASGTY